MRSNPMTCLWHGRLRGAPLATALACAAGSAAFWGWASGSDQAGLLTLVCLVAHAVLSPREGESAWTRAGLSFLVGGTWAAQQLILRYRLPQ